MEWNWFGKESFNRQQSDTCCKTAISIPPAVYCVSHLRFVYLLVFLVIFDVAFTQTILGSIGEARSKGSCFGPRSKCNILSLSVGREGTCAGANCGKRREVACANALSSRNVEHLGEGRKLVQKLPAQSLEVDNGVGRRGHGKASVARQRVSTHPHRFTVRCSWQE